MRADHRASSNFQYAACLTNLCNHRLHRVFLRLFLRCAPLTLAHLLNLIPSRQTTHLNFSTLPTFDVKFQIRLENLNLRFPFNFSMANTSMEYNPQDMTYSKKGVRETAHERSE